MKVLRKDDGLTDIGSNGGGDKGPELADGFNVRVVERAVGFGGKRWVKDDAWVFCWSS